MLVYISLEKCLEFDLIPVRNCEYDSSIIDISYSLSKSLVVFFRLEYSQTPLYLDIFDCVKSGIILIDSLISNIAIAYFFRKKLLPQTCLRDALSYSLFMITSWR